MSEIHSKSQLHNITRRQLIGIPFGLAASKLLSAEKADKRKKAGAVITEYRRNSHADVIVGRMLNGYYYEGTKIIPRIAIASMFTDQVPENDLSRAQAVKHNVPICKTITEALMLGTNSLAVDGVVLIGEHGNYPANDKGQLMYPRYELYQQIVDVFRKTEQMAPVFCDKHLSYDWHKAKWMYDQALQMGFPFMAGSSIPLTWRQPELELEIGTPFTRAVVPYGGPTDAYGFHALEGLQCMVERRPSGETGIAAVQCLQGPSVWKWTDANPWAERLLVESLNVCSEVKDGYHRVNVKVPTLFIVEYSDGLLAAIYQLNGHISRTWGFAAEIHGESEPVATQFKTQTDRPFSHFDPLVRYIEDMIMTGKTPYPVERTLLTTGALAALHDSLYYNSRRLLTPHLAISYQPIKESLFVRGPMPQAESDFGIGP